MGNHKGKPRIKKDHIHYDSRKMDKYNRAFNFLISMRETGKSTAIINKIMKMYVHHHRPSLVIRRQIVDIDEAYIQDLIKPYNKFKKPEHRISLYLKKGDIKSGIVDCFLDAKMTKLLFRVQALSIPNSRGKSRMLDDLGYIFFDEYLINPLKKEKYIDGEVDSFRELYNTYYRDARDRGHSVRCFFCGNPYTVFNPFHAWLNIPLSKIKRGSFLVGKNWTLECIDMSPELRELILKTNPLYDEEDPYMRYAFDGQAIADERFIIGTRPLNAKLKFVFRISDKYLLIWNASTENNSVGKYYCETQIEKPETSKVIRAVDFNNLIQDTRLIDFDIKELFSSIKLAIQLRQMCYKDVECGYLIQQLYLLI